MAIVHGNQENFEKITSEGITLVDFYADWCGPCQMLSPELEKLDPLLSAGQQIVKVNVDDNQEIASKYEVMSIPTMVLLKDGKVVGQKVGVKTAEEMQTWIDGQ